MIHGKQWFECVVECKYLGYEVIREVTVGAGCVVRSPVDIHGAAAVLATLSSDLYDHVHELGEAGLAVLLLEPVVEELLGLHELVLVCGHKPARASDKLDLGMSAIEYKNTFHTDASQCYTKCFFVTPLCKI